MRPTLGDARDIVGRVSFERLYIRDDLGAESAVAFLDSGYVVERLVAHGVAEQDPYPRGYELEGIGVAGEDYGVYLPLACLTAKRAKKVVGLVSGPLEYGHAKRAHEVLDMVELRPEFRGRWRTVRLVLGEPLVPECGSGDVERHGNVGGIPVAQRLQEYVHIAEYGANVFACGAQVERLAYSVPGAMNERVAVYEDEERLAFQHGEGVGSIHK